MNMAGVDMAGVDRAGNNRAGNRGLARSVLPALSCPLCPARSVLPPLSTPALFTSQPYRNPPPAIIFRG